MRLKALVALLFLAGDLVTATPISCSEVCSFFNVLPVLSNPRLTTNRSSNATLSSRASCHQRPAAATGGVSVTSLWPCFRQPHPRIKVEPALSTGLTASRQHETNLFFLLVHPFLRHTPSRLHQAAVTSKWDCGIRRSYPIWEGSSIGVLWDKTVGLRLVAPSAQAFLRQLFLGTCVLALGGLLLALNILPAYPVRTGRGVRASSFDKMEGFKTRRDLRLVGGSFCLLGMA